MLLPETTVVKNYYSTLLGQNYYKKLSPSEPSILKKYHNQKLGLLQVTTIIEITLTYNNRRLKLSLTTIIIGKHHLLKQEQQRQQPIVTTLKWRNYHKVV